MTPIGSPENCPVFNRIYFLYLAAHSYVALRYFLEFSACSKILSYTSSELTEVFIYTWKEGETTWLCIQLFCRRALASQMCEGFSWMLLTLHCRLLVHTSQYTFTKTQKTRSGDYLYKAGNWWRWGDSNPRPNVPPRDVYKLSRWSKVLKDIGFTNKTSTLHSLL